MAEYKYQLWDGSKLKEGKNYSKGHIYKTRSHIEDVLYTLREDGVYGVRIYKIKNGYVVLRKSREAKKKDKLLKERR